MSGIFPENGVAADKTVGALTSPSVATGVIPLWYANRCNPRLNAAAMNALISEFLNLIDASGNAYDPTLTVNLANAVQAMCGEMVSAEAITTAIKTLVDGAPDSLNTIGKLATALCNDPNFCSNTQADIAELVTGLATLDQQLSALMSNGGPVTEVDVQIAVDTMVARIVNGAPSPLDTLSGFANAMGNDPNFATTVFTALTGKEATFSVIDGGTF